VLYGHASGIVDDFNTMELAEAGSVFLTRPHMEHCVATPAEYANRAHDILTWVAGGKLKARIQAVLPLAEAADAHRTLAGRETRGKLLLRIAE
jgi:NADPH2:quinone reductase